MLTQGGINQARKYCANPIEMIEGYERAMNEPGMFEVHHKLEEQGYSKHELIDKDLYYNRPAEELVFLTRLEHSRLHMKNIQISEDHRRNISKSRKGIQFSEETRKKLSETKKGKSIKYRIDICPALLQMMRYEQYLTLQQISVQLGVSIGTIHNKLLLKK